MSDPSYSRTDPRAGWVHHSRRLDACRECGSGPLPIARRTFCSDECVHAWKLRSSQAYAAGQVLKRDKGVCAECGIDCVQLQKDLRALLSETRKARALDLHDCLPLTFEIQDRTHAYGARIAELGLKGERARLRRRLWDMDHAVPVSEGGGSCGLDNLRTLCWRCHARATGELRRRLNARAKR